MIHARIHHLTAGVLAIALTVAVALSTTTVSASARTFDFNSAGSMVQQPLPPQWGCVILRALSGGKFHCQDSPARWR
jgi:hypothetical protein